VSTFQWMVQGKWLAKDLSTKQCKNRAILAIFYFVWQSLSRYGKCPLFAYIIASRTRQLAAGFLFDKIFLYSLLIKSVIYSVVLVLNILYAPCISLVRHFFASQKSKWSSEGFFFYALSLFILISLHCSK